jgi:hypothetical protein
MISALLLISTGEGFTLHRAPRSSPVQGVCSLHGP